VVVVEVVEVVEVVVVVVVVVVGITEPQGTLIHLLVPVSQTRASLLLGVGALQSSKAPPD
jgi:hypothetical protein